MGDELMDDHSNFATAINTSATSDPMPTGRASDAEDRSVAWNMLPTSLPKEADTSGASEKASPRHMEEQDAQTTIESQQFGTSGSSWWLCSSDCARCTRT